MLHLFQAIQLIISALGTIFNILSYGAVLGRDCKVAPGLKREFAYCLKFEARFTANRCQLQLAKGANNSRRGFSFAVVGLLNKKGELRLGALMYM